MYEEPRWWKTPIETDQLYEKISKNICDCANFLISTTGKEKVAKWTKGLAVNHFWGGHKK